MRARLPLAAGSVIRDVFILSGKHAEGPTADEYGAYSVRIETDQGTFLVYGCHDTAPDTDRAKQFE